MSCGLKQFYRQEHNMINWLKPRGTPIEWADIRIGDVIEWRQPNIATVKRGEVTRVDHGRLIVDVWTVYPTDAICLVHRPVPPQPDEPKKFAAAVRVDRIQFVRVDDRSHTNTSWFARGGAYNWYSWNDITALGPVTVLSEGTPEMNHRQPGEPKGSAAVIDVDGKRFTRIPSSNGDTMPWVHRTGHWATWDDILALGPVTVLSEGVTE